MFQILLLQKEQSVALPLDYSSGRDRLDVMMPVLVFVDSTLLCISKISLVRVAWYVCKKKRRKKRLYFHNVNNLNNVALMFTWHGDSLNPD